MIGLKGVDNEPAFSRIKSIESKNINSPCYSLYNGREHNIVRHTFNNVIAFMTASIALLILFLMTLIAANIPFISDRILFFFESTSPKSFWLRLLEWFIMYVLILALATGLEIRLHGEAYRKIWEFWNFSEHWEFYSITLCLFLVFALPGYIYQYDLKKHFK